MRYTQRQKVGPIELTYLLLGALLLLLLGAVAARGQARQPLYREYRGVRLGMTATEVRAKLGEPVMKSNEQDFYVVSPTETTQIAYDVFQKVLTISTDYTAGAPDYKTVVGDGMLLQRPDGSLFRMMQYQSEGFWVSYNKSASVVPVVTITMQQMK